LAFYVACIKHRCFLTNRCVECGAENHYGRGSDNKCFDCGQFLRYQTIPATENALSVSKCISDLDRKPVNNESEREHLNVFLQKIAIIFDLTNPERFDTGWLIRHNPKITDFRDISSNAWKWLKSELDFREMAKYAYRERKIANLFLPDLGHAEKIRNICTFYDEIIQEENSCPSEVKITKSRISELRHEKLSIKFILEFLGLELACFQELARTNHIDLQTRGADIKASVSAGDIDYLCRLIHKAAPVEKEADWVAKAETFAVECERSGYGLATAQSMLLKDILNGTRQASYTIGSSLSAMLVRRSR
jgi:hypothetical protein